MTWLLEGYADAPDEPNERRWERDTPDGVCSNPGAAARAPVETVLFRRKMDSASGGGGPVDVDPRDGDGDEDVGAGPGEVAGAGDPGPPLNAAVDEGGPRGCLIGADDMACVLFDRVC